MRIPIRWPKTVRRTQGLPCRTLDGHVIAAVAHPDAIQIFHILEVAHRFERNMDDAIDIVLILGHLGLQHADDSKADAADTNALADGIIPENNLVAAWEPSTATWLRSWLSCSV